MCTEKLSADYLSFIEDMHEFFESKFIGCLPKEPPFIEEDGLKVINIDAVYEHLVEGNNLTDPED
jgi:hypothetical protein